MMIVCVYSINEKCVRLSRVMMHFQFQYNFRAASPPSSHGPGKHAHTYTHIHTRVIIRLHNVMWCTFLELLELPFAHLFASTSLSEVNRDAERQRTI